ncbi:hypothetical protein LQW54_009024 [Pestalotiopsis sp. IQ-011]
MASSHERSQGPRVAAETPHHETIILHRPVTLPHTQYDLSPLAMRYNSPHSRNEHTTTVTTGSPRPPAPLRHPATASPPDIDDDDVTLVDDTAPRGASRFSNVWYWYGACSGSRHRGLMRVVFGS